MLSSLSSSAVFWKFAISFAIFADSAVWLLTGFDLFGNFVLEGTSLFIG